MSKDTTRVRFANAFTGFGESFKQGGVYELPAADARHYVRIGKAAVVAPNTKTEEQREAEERGDAVTKANAKTKAAAATEDGGKAAKSSDDGKGDRKAATEDGGTTAEKN